MFLINITKKRKKEIKIVFEKNTVYLEIIESLVEGCHLDTIKNGLAASQVISYIEKLIFLNYV